MKIGIIIVIILGLAVVGYGLFQPADEPAATPTQTPTPDVVATTTPTRTPSPSLSPTITPSGAPSQTITPTPTETFIPSLSPTVTPTPTATVSPTPTVQAHLILMQNRTYSPSTITVTKGDTVVFRAVDTFYSVVVTGRSSGRLQPGQEWTLNSGDYLPGTYTISDATYTTMRGTFIVQ